MRLRLGRDVETGEAEVLHCTSTDVVFLDPFEDEGPCYFFDVGDGRILFLGGQYLEEFYPEAETGGNLRAGPAPSQQFPNREFVIVRDSGSESMLDVRCLGQDLSPSRVVNAACIDTAALTGWTVFEGRLATLESDVQRLHRESLRS